jgi:hypothetical protein
MRKLAIVAVFMILATGCVPEKPPVQNDFLMNLKRTDDFKLAVAGHEIDISDGMMFNLQDAKMVTSMPNTDPDSPFDKIYNTSGAFLVCRAKVWKTKPEATFPKYDVISVVPSFVNISSDPFIISHAQLAYGLPFFDPSKITAVSQEFVFVFQIRIDELGWTFNFYRTENSELKLSRMVDTGQ